MKISGVRVLILEPEPVAKSRLEKVCLHFNADCKSVETCDQVRTEVASFRPHMVILDGESKDALFGLVKDLRNTDATMFAPIYGVAKRERDDEKAAWLRAGVDDCIETPFDLNDLKYQIYSFLFQASKIDHLRREKRTLEERAKSAEISNAAKTKFLVNMSHDIRTPISGVIGMTNFLTNSDLRIEQKDFVETIMSSGETALAILEDILDYGKIESGNLELLEKPVSLTQSYEEALDTVSPRAAEKDLNINFQIDEEVQELMVGDEKRIRQILTNLIGNAIKFTSEGDVTVTVERSGLKEGKDILLFSVSDTGIGIKKEQLDNLFEYFRQADVFIGSKYGGYGLGLAISKGLVNLMGGHIWVESEFGKGTTFKFEIPLSRCDQASTSETSAKNILGRCDELSGKSILLVDTFKPERKILASYFRKWGMHVDQRDNIADLVSIIKTSATQNDFIFVHSSDQSGHLDQTLKELSDFIKASRFKTKIIASLPYQRFWDTAREHENNSVSLVPRPLKYSVVQRAIQQETEGGSSISAGTTKMNKNESPDQSLKQHGKLSSAKNNSAIESESTLAEKLPLNILLVDDNHINLRVAGQLVKQLGYNHYHTAENGQEAIDMSAEQHFDFILMDVQMPVVDGLDATRQIRDQEMIQGSKPSKIVAMTANVMAEDRANCLNAGMDEYLSKPIRSNTLKKTIQNLVRNVPTPASQLIHDRAKKKENQTDNQNRNMTNDGSLEKQFEDHFDNFDIGIENSDMLENSDSSYQKYGNDYDRDSNVVDIVHLEEISGKDQEIMRDIASQYLKDASQRVVQLRAALKISDYEKARRICHNFAGASATCGVVGVEKLLREMEVLCKNKEVPYQDQLFQSLDEEIAKVGSFFLNNQLMFA